MKLCNVATVTNKATFSWPFLGCLGNRAVYINYIVLKLQVFLQIHWHLAPKLLKRLSISVKAIVYGGAFVDSGEEQHQTFISLCTMHRNTGVHQCSCVYYQHPQTFQFPFQVRHMAHCQDKHDWIRFLWHTLEILRWRAEGFWHSKFTKTACKWLIIANIPLTREHFICWE